MYKRTFIAAALLASTTACVHNQSRPEHGDYKVGDLVVLSSRVDVTQCEVAENSVTGMVGSPLFKRCIGGTADIRDPRVIEVLDPPVTFKVTRVFSQCLLGGCNQYTVVKTKDKGRKYILVGGSSGILKPVRGP